MSRFMMQRLVMAVLCVDLYSDIELDIKLQLLVPVAIIHAIAPGIFTKTASNAMKGILLIDNAN